ncbi:LPS-assembly protein LptD [Rhodovibrio sodomensis]|nr:LPS assembly protein LptD [Rhodovibrio sodomensis]
MPDWRRRLSAGVAAAALLVALGPVARAQDSASAPETQQEVRETPAVLQADEVEYRDDREIVIARGNVEIAQGERILLADEVRYNIPRDVITATGDVSLLQPSGEVIFGDRVRVTGDLREGTIEAFRMLLTDNSRLAAANAVRVNANRTYMNRAVYSPCDVCEDDPDSAPLWQVRAARVIHDQQDQRLYYRHTRLELFDIPVFYTPYFSHPDPTAERQTGLLTPTIGYSSSLGATLRPRYYVVLSDQADFTFAPLFTTNAGQVAQGTYRRETATGSFEVTGSITQAANLDDAADTTANLRFDDPTVADGDLRGHLDTTGQFNIDENWRWGWDAKWVSDDAYLERYGYEFEDPLQSELYAERFEGRNYFTAEAMTFQGLRRQGDDAEQPLILPNAEYAYISDPDYLGGQLFGNLGVLNLMRTEGRDTRRLSGTVGWERSYVEDLGGRISLKGLTNVDAYSYQDTVDGSDVIVPPAGTREDGQAARVFPQAAVSYGYPLTRSTWLGSEVIEPRAQLVVGPNGGNSSRIPNETSRTFEFTAGNLFALDRVPGRDRVSSGQRVDYGLEYTYTTPEGQGTASALIGQSYRINSDSALPDTVGGDQEFSDIVGQLSVSPVRYLSGRYDFRVDDETGELGLSEAAITVGPPALRLGASYTLVEAQQSELASFREREQLNLRLDSRLSRYWSLSARHRQNLRDAEPLDTSLGVSYQDECFLIRVSANRDYANRAGVEDDTTIMVTIGLKNLGAFGTSPANRR